MTPDKSDNPGQVLAVRDRKPGQDRTPPYKGVRLSGCPNLEGRHCVSPAALIGKPTAVQKSHFCELTIRTGQFANARLAASEA